jgi:hypothetical protein
VAAIIFNGKNFIAHASNTNIFAILGQLYRLTFND